MKLLRWIKQIFKSPASLPDLPVEHDWEMISSTYSPPRRDITSIASLNLKEDVLQKALTGVTTYLWQCQRTGELRSEELLGSDKDELSELADKVERTGGIVYVRINGETYAIAKWVPPQEASETIPIK